MPGTSMSGSSQAFDVAYPDSPWANLDRNQRQWYDPILRDIYRQLNVFGQFTTFQVNNGDVNAKTMTLSGLYDLQVNTDPIGPRQNWLPASHVDSWQVDVTFQTYANKVAYNKYDKIITYWRDTGRINADTLRAISNDKLGINISDTLDMLSRNSLLSLPYTYYGPLGNYSKIDDITAADTFLTETLDEIHLGMQNRSVPYAKNPSGDIGSIACITSPGVQFDIRKQSNPRDWLYRAAYARPEMLWNYELGSFDNARFIVTPKCTLWNAGAVSYQTTVSAPIAAGDGSPSTLVDNTRRVGQAGATHYIQLVNTTTMSNYAVNDIITIHVLRGDGSNARICNGGVDWTDGTLTNRRVVSIDAGNHRLVLDKPVMQPFTTDLGGTVYAYVTKGIHIHASIFVGAPDVVAVGVGRPMEIHTPPPVDDRESIYRVSWDINAGWQNYNPDAGEVVFTAGTTRLVGAPLQ